MGRPCLRAFQTGAGAGAWGLRVHGGACGWEGPLDSFLGEQAFTQVTEALCSVSCQSYLTSVRTVARRKCQCE